MTTPSSTAITDFISACRRLNWAGAIGQTVWVERPLFDELVERVGRFDDQVALHTEIDYWRGPVKVAGILVEPLVELVPA